MKSRFIVLLACVLGLTTGIAINYQRFLPNPSGSLQNTEPSDNIITALANWAILAYTTEELYDSADVVVRGQVVATHNRILTETLQIHRLTGDTAERAKDVPEHILLLKKGMEERGMEGNPDELTLEQKQVILEETTLDTQPIGEEISHVALTDTTLEVTEVLKGKVNKTIIITQAGGSIPTPGNAESTHTANLEFIGNPLLQTGDEYILFLIHRKADTHEVDTEGLELYELSSPTGQFRISGDAVSNTGDVHAAHSVGGENLNKLPTNLDTLLAEIQQASEAE